LTAEPPGRARTCIRSVALRDLKVRPLATIGTDILSKNASSGTTNVCYMTRNTIDVVVLINSSTLSVIGVVSWRLIPTPEYAWGDL